MPLETLFSLVCDGCLRRLGPTRFCGSLILRAFVDGWTHEDDSIWLCNPCWVKRHEHEKVDLKIDVNQPPSI
jgi:hypothetical protein